MEVQQWHSTPLTSARNDHPGWWTSSYRQCAGDRGEGTPVARAIDQVHRIAATERTGVPACVTGPALQRLAMSNRSRSTWMRFTPAVAGFHAAAWVDTWNGAA